MAQAGFCSECGQNVFLDASGGCVNGHGPECVTGTYAVADQPVATAAPAAAPSYAAAPVTAAPPKKKRTGLVVTVVLVALLLLCGCAAGAYFLLAPSGSKPTGATSATGTSAAAKDSKGQITAAFSFLKGMGGGEIELFKSVMPQETVTAVPKETWDSMMANAAADPTVFGPLSVSGETGTATFSSSDGTKGSMDFRITGTDLVVVTLKPEASESEDATLTLNLEKDRWTVTSFETIDGVLKFDAASMKALGQ